jgi:hypothetical protein
MKRVSPDIAAQLFPTARPDCGYFVSQSGKILMNKHAPPLSGSTQQTRTKSAEKLIEQAGPLLWIGIAEKVWQHFSDGGV